MRTLPAELVELDDLSVWVRVGDRMARIDQGAWFAAAPTPAAIVVPVTPPAALPRPAVKEKPPAPAPESTGQGRPTDPAKIAEARQLFENTDRKLRDISEAVGVKYNTLFGIATRSGWQRKTLARRPA